jgi:hypothetical protein
MICWLHTGNFSTDPLAVKVDTVLEAKTIGSILIPLPLYIMHLKWCSWYLWSPHLFLSPPVALLTLEPMH